MPPRPGPPTHSFSAPPGPHTPVTGQQAEKESKSTVKTAFSKLRKHKKTYALTKLGVRVVAGAIVGADVGDAIDAFDGMDIGDAGDAGLTDTDAGVGSGVDMGPGADMGSGTADYSNVGGGGIPPMADPGAGGITAGQVNQYMNSTIGMQPALDMSSLNATN
jgi:hypothetical protein